MDVLNGFFLSEFCFISVIASQIKHDLPKHNKVYIMKHILRTL